MRQGSTTSHSLGGKQAWYNEVLDVFAALFLGRPSAKLLRFVPNTNEISERKNELRAPTSLLSASAAANTSSGDQFIADIVLPSEILLVRALAIPKTARSKLEEISTLDLARRTPFKASDVYAAVSLKDVVADDLHATQWVIKRTEVDAIIRRLGNASVRVRKVLADAGGNLVVLTDRSDVIAPYSAIWRRMNLGLVSLAGLLAIALWLYPGWRAQSAAKALEPKLAEKRAEVVETRQKLDQKSETATSTEQFLQAAIRHPRLVEILRNLTVALPDDVWLSDVVLRNGQLVVSGETSGSAADLVLALAKSRELNDPKLSGPVSRTAAGSERFQIALRVGAVK
ncbi:PilN domain-containing protein [Aliiroseovarius sp. CAU 1755]